MPNSQLRARIAALHAEASAIGVELAERAAEMERDELFEVSKGKRRMTYPQHAYWPPMNPPPPDPVAGTTRHRDVTPPEPPPF
ncbi:MAG: hypothetical protein ACJ714_16600 [Ornithinibacter sp.]